jgi:TatA/E family protein of Tat protein translocase
MPQLGPAEVLVILVVALLVFGPKRLPEVGRQVGRGLRELRKIQETVRDELNDVLHHDEPEDPPRYTSPPPVAVAGSTPGRQAPSRFRAAGTPALGAAAAGDPAVDAERDDAAPAASARGVTPPAVVPAAHPAHAPSRFRAPGR